MQGRADGCPGRDRQDLLIAEAGLDPSRRPALRCAETAPPPAIASALETPWIGTIATATRDDASRRDRASALPRRRSQASERPPPSRCRQRDRWPRGTT